MYDAPKEFPAGSGNYWPPVDLLQVARNVGKTSRATYCACHFYGGGGDAVKHGDLDSSLTQPTRELDVHMSVLEGGIGIFPRRVMVADRDAFLYAHAYGNAYAHRHAHGNTTRYGDTFADSHATQLSHSLAVTHAFALTNATSNARAHDRAGDRDYQVRYTR